MFKQRRAQMALLINMHEELVRKIDEQIKLEREFITSLTRFFAFEEKMKMEQIRRDELDKEDKRVLDNDRKY
jgi:NAD(P)H-nitrite reductase large subunit